jgi:hypothetical protein
MRGIKMAIAKGLDSVVSQLRVERMSLVNELRHVDAALSVLGKLNNGRAATAQRRTFSASARRKMSLAQKARWAKKASDAQVSVTRTKRTMSASSRKKIAAAQRARWAKVKGQKKAA